MDRSPLRAPSLPSRARAGLNHHSSANVTASALAWLTAIRKAAPSSSVFLCVPFGGFERQALLDAYTQFQQPAPDARTHVVDTGAQGEVGTTQFVSGGTFEACDGIHPRAPRHGQLGALLAVKIAALQQQGG